jgi:hypothetical protein
VNGWPAPEGRPDKSKCARLGRWPLQNQDGGLKPPLPEQENPRTQAEAYATGGGASGLGVGFDEPEVFVHFAGDGGEEVDGDGVLEVVGFLDGGAQGVGEVADVVDQEFDHVGAVEGGEIGFGDTGLGGGFANGAVGDAAESGDALCDCVDVIFQACGD